MKSAEQILKELYQTLDDIERNYKIEMLQVGSSNIVSLGFNPFKKILEVEFKGGKKPNSLYRYFDVPDDIFLGVALAESHGTYFHKNIKGKYKFARVR